MPINGSSATVRLEVFSKTSGTFTKTGDVSAASATKNPPVGTNLQTHVGINTGTTASAVGIGIGRIAECQNN